MAYAMTLLDCQWSAIAERLERCQEPVDQGLVKHIRLVLGHQPAGCTCQVTIDLSPAQADLVRRAIPTAEAAALALMR